MMTELGVTKSNCAYSAHQANNITTTLIARSISILVIMQYLVGTVSHVVLILGIMYGGVAKRLKIRLIKNQ